MQEASDNKDQLLTQLKRKADDSAVQHLVKDVAALRKECAGRKTAQEDLVAKVVRLDQQISGSTATAVEATAAPDQTRISCALPIDLHASYAAHFTPQALSVAVSRTVHSSVFTLCRLDPIVSLQGTLFSPPPPAELPPALQPLLRSKCQTRNSR